MFLVASLAACSSAPESVAPVSAQVSLEGLAFVPPSVRVSRPGTVTWTDGEPVEHTITAGTPATPNRALFDMVLKQDETFSFVFQQAGTFEFFCKRHPANMQGTVTVV